MKSLGESPDYLKEQIDHDKKFYLGLGYTEAEAEHLAQNIFSDNLMYSSNTYPGINTLNSLKYTGRSTGLGGACTNSRSLGICELDELLDYSMGMQPVHSEVYEDSEDSEDSEDLEECDFGELVECSADMGQSSMGEVSKCARREESTIPFGVDINDTSFSTFVGNKLEDVEDHPTSSFKATVNTASFSGLKAGMGSLTRLGTKIRTEEVINAAIYDLETGMSTVTGDLGDTKYMLAAYKAEQVDAPKQNIVVLMDVSGSMGTCSRETQKCLMTILKQLKDDDTISLVTYSYEDKVCFEALKASQISDVILKIGNVAIGGCTAGSVGLRKAYDIALKHFIPNGSNRIVLITDGDFNFDISDEDGLTRLVKDKKQTGVYLTVVGMNNYIYDEGTMEVLARNGNGNYFRVVDEADILMTLRDKFIPNTVAVAKDVKFKIKFRSDTVESYKLFGYETRAITGREYNDDSVEAEPIGSGHTVVALYELHAAKDADKDSTGKIEKPLGTFSMRSKGIKVSDTESAEQSIDIMDTGKTLESSKNLIQAYASMVAAEQVKQYKETRNIDKKTVYAAIVMLKSIIEDTPDSIMNVQLKQNKALLEILNTLANV